MAPQKEPPRGGRKPSRNPPSTKSGGPASRPPRKLVAVEPDILQALEWLARDRMQTFEELADEAFRDVLKKHHRPVTLKEALKQSVRMPANDARPPRRSST